MTTKEIKPKVTEKTSAADQAQMLNSSSIMSAVTSEAFSKKMFPNLELPELIIELRDKIEKVQAGDMSEIDAMLVGQAQALQTIFVSLARRASNQEYLKQYSLYMNLALKAQSQCRATIQALTELKYPKQVAFVKQANIAHGHQQINNGNKNNTSSRAEENQNQQNELLEVNNGSKKMDIRAAKTAIRTDKKMAAMDKKYGSKNT